MTDLHPFCSMSIGPPIPETWLFQNLTMKVKAMSHRWIPLTKASDGYLRCVLRSGLKKQLSKQLRCWWFEMPSCSLWHHCNATPDLLQMSTLPGEQKRKRLHNATEDVFLWHLKMTHYAAQMTSASSWQGAASHCQLNLAMPDQGLRPSCLYVMGCPNLIVAVDNAPLVIPLGDWSLNDIPNSCLLCLKEKTLPFR